MYQNTIYICISWYSKICWFLVKKILMSAELKGCVTWFIYFLDFIWVRYKCAKFHHCRTCIKDFREEVGIFGPLYPWAAPKNSILNRVKGYSGLLWFWVSMTFCQFSSLNFHIIPNGFLAASPVGKFFVGLTPEISWTFYMLYCKSSRPNLGT